MRRNTLSVLAVTVLLALAFLWIRSAGLLRVRPAPEAAVADSTVADSIVADFTAARGRSLLQPAPDSARAAAPPDSRRRPAPPAGPTAVVPPRLVVPVQGVRPLDLVDTFTEARASGRVHNAIDILAPKGTPVLAAADGRIARLFLSERGGKTIYQQGTDRRIVYYYAHLDSYAEGLRENEVVRQGQVIGYVGDTGNAVPGNDHLHFAIWITADTSQFWDGTEINPFPLLAGQP